MKRPDINLPSPASPIPAGWFALLIAGMILAGASANQIWVHLRGGEADLVLGQPDFVTDNFSTNQQGMRLPSDVAIDPVSGKIFVSDQPNHRILRYPSTAALNNHEPAEAVFGQADFISNASPNPPTAASLNLPRGLAIDGAGRLWVADNDNNRILRYDDAANKASGSNADGVLGQPDFTTSAGATTATGLKGPEGVAVDDLGNLWVADHENARALRYNNAAAKANGAAADAVLGQTNFTTGTAGLSGSRLFGATAIAVTKDGQTLWVSDFAPRVLRFDNVLAKANGAAADGVLGQFNFFSTVAGLSASNFGGFITVMIDEEGGLWVCDHDNHRVLLFSNAAAKANGADADGVLGQPDFVSNTSGLTATQLNGPIGTATEGCDTVWVADFDNGRVLRFRVRFQPDGWIGTKAAAQKGDDIHNTTGANQNARVKVDGSRAGKTFFTIQNDAFVADNMLVRATKGNRKLKVKYLQTPGGNVTAAMIRGRHLIPGLRSGATSKYKARITGTRKSRGKGARRTLTVTPTSQGDGSRDTVKAKIKKTR